MKGRYKIISYYLLLYPLAYLVFILVQRNAPIEPHEGMVGTLMALGTIVTLLFTLTVIPAGLFFFGWSRENQELKIGSLLCLALALTLDLVFVAEFFG